jgi:hypothetical protein
MTRLKNGKRDLKEGVRYFSAQPWYARCLMAPQHSLQQRCANTAKRVKHQGSFAGGDVDREHIVHKGSGISRNPWHPAVYGEAAIVTKRRIAERLLAIALCPGSNIEQRHLLRLPRVCSTVFSRGAPPGACRFFRSNFSVGDRHSAWLFWQTERGGVTPVCCVSGPSICQSGWRRQGLTNH